MDLCSRRLVGWAIADHMRTELVLDALTAAQRTRGSLAGAVFHSDHGSQAIQRSGVRGRLPRGGGDPIHGRRRQLGGQLQDAQNWDSEREARLAVFGWLHRYNTRRRHSHLGQMSPIDYENSLTPTPATLTHAA